MLNFGLYKGAEMSDVPTEYLETVGSELSEQAKLIERELNVRKFAPTKEDKIGKEPAYYRLFSKACISDKGQEFLESLRLTGKQWEYWFLYVISNCQVRRHLAPSPSEIAQNYFRGIGVAGF